MKIELTDEYRLSIEDLSVDDYDLDLTMKIVLAIERHAIKNKLDYGQIIHSLNCNKAIQYEKLKDIPILEIKNIMIHVLNKNSDHKQNLELDEFSIKLSNGDITYE